MGGCFATENTHFPINSVLGDQSFIEKFGKDPTTKTNEILRITTHLEYVEEILKKKEVTHLTDEQQTNRLQIIQLLNDYRVNKAFPKNYDFPNKRLPCFIDKTGNICAVGYLIEKTAGRAVSERINEGYKYARIVAIQIPEVDEWIRKNGLTKKECAMIQPEYEYINEPQPEPVLIDVMPIPPPTDPYIFEPPTFYPMPYDQDFFTVTLMPTFVMDTMAAFKNDSLLLVQNQRQNDIDSLMVALNSQSVKNSKLGAKQKKKDAQIKQLSGDVESQSKKSNWIIGILSILAIGTISFLLFKSMSGAKSRTT